VAKRGMRSLTGALNAYGSDSFIPATGTSVVPLARFFLSHRCAAARQGDCHSM